MDRKSGARLTESLWCRRLPLILSLGYGAVGILYIFASDQLLLVFLSDPERLTALQTFKGTAFVAITAVLLYLVTGYGVKRLRAAERESRMIDERCRRMVEASNEGVWMLDESGRTAFVNETLARLVGVNADQMLDRPFVEFMVPEFRLSAEQEFDRCRAGASSQYECRLVQSDGSEVWVIISSSPMRDDEGGFCGACQMVTNITEHKQAETALRTSVAEQKRLLDELDHRVRNNLSSVLGLLQLARTGAPEAEALADSMAGRVRAMSRAYSLLSASGWAGQDLARLIGTLVPGELRDRVTLRGEQVRIPPHQTGALAMMFHELFTNAQRHGALANDHGTVEISWSRVESADSEDKSVRVELEWVEWGGPPIDSPPQPQAGWRLIDGLAASDLRGSAALTFPQSGAHHTFQIELFNRRDAADEIRRGDTSLATRS